MNNGNHKPRVRFTEPENEEQQEQSTSGGVRRRKKRPRTDEVEDDIDQADHWTQEDDGELDDDVDPSVPSQHDLLQAKIDRRLKRMTGGHADEDGDHAGEGSTHIDETTSLAAEGIAIEPFHMENEKSDGTGYFDGDTFVFRKEKAEPDAWLDALDDNEPTSNSGRGVDSDRNQTQSTTSEDSGETDDQTGMDEWTEEELYAKILPYVSDTETILQAISRYGRLINQKKPPSSRRSDDTSTAVKKKEGETSILAKSALDELTQASSSLMLKGHVDIYQKTRNSILSLLSAATAKQSTPTVSTVEKSSGQTSVPIVGVQWEYQGSEDNAIHGPYSTEEMLGWIKAGYFVGPSAVKVRSLAQVPKGDSTTNNSISLQDDLLSDLMDDEEGEKPGTTKSVASDLTELTPGEWILSDQVDFSRYL